MSDEALFGTAPDPTVPAAPAAALISDEQIAELRAVLDRSGISDMRGRQMVVERALGRPLERLRDLSASDARVLATKLHALFPLERQERSGSSNWDDRDFDTWIDQL